MSFASDNTAGCIPAVLNAVIEANKVPNVSSYGDDPLTAQMKTQLRTLFDKPELEAYAVATGTAANCLCLAHMCPPWGAVLCSNEAHVLTDESGAPEFFAGGLIVRTLPSENGKISADELARYMERFLANIHKASPKVICITNSTEVGTVYSVEDVRNICNVAHRHGILVHMDGARISNAVAHLGCEIAELTWKAGVDALSFGFTKAGAMLAEVAVVFDPLVAQDFDCRRKRAGQLISKHRFVACQVIAMLQDDNWLHCGQTGNKQATKIIETLVAHGLQPVYPVQANEIFVTVPEILEQKMREAGLDFYRWTSEPCTEDPSKMNSVIRLVTSFSTTDQDVQTICDVISSVCA